MKYSVLLALEDLETRDFYSSSLESAGYAVVTCTPGDALRIATQRQPDVAIIDGSRVPGASACGEFKLHPGTEKVALIALVQPESTSRFDQLCDAVLPIDCLPGPLVEAVDRVLVRSRRAHGRSEG